MQIALYPHKLNLVAGVAIGAGFVWLGQHLYGNVAEGGDPLVFTALSLATAGFGAWSGVRSLMRLVRPTPSFYADDDGFAVMGGKMRPWNEFQGVGVTTLQQKGIDTVKSVYVLAGPSRIRTRKLNINWIFLSGSAAVMARKISVVAQEQALLNRMESMPETAEAARALRNARAEGQSAGPAPTAPDPAPSPTAVKTDFDDGPIKSDKGFGARLFGG